jgi:hypothetical protein
VGRTRTEEIRAGELRLRDVFLMPVSRARGAVVDIKRAVVDDGTSRHVLRAPRVLLVGKGGVTKRTLHPDVVVLVRRKEL